MNDETNADSTGSSNAAVGADNGTARPGQAAFNALWSWRPDVARLITASDADPYYDDRNLPTFHRRVVELLEELGGDEKQSTTTEDPVAEVQAYVDGTSNHPPTRQVLKALLANQPDRVRGN
jgi:hypothetical protein